MKQVYRATLQLSLHDAPNPLDPVGATDWNDTRASEFTPVEVVMSGEVLSRAVAVSLVAARAVGPGAVWALFVDRWQAAKPLYWEGIGGQGLSAGATFALLPGDARLPISDSFAVRNVAASIAGR